MLHAECVWRRAGHDAYIFRTVIHAQGGGLLAEVTALTRCLLCTLGQGTICIHLSSKDRQCCMELARALQDHMPGQLRLTTMCQATALCSVSYEQTLRCRQGASRGTLGRWSGGVNSGGTFGVLLGSLGGVHVATTPARRTCCRPLLWCKDAVGSLAPAAKTCTC